MNRRTAVLGLGSIVAAWPSCSHAQSLPRQGPWGLTWRDIPKICILSAELSRLGSAFRLGTTAHSLRTISADDLRAYGTTPRIVTPSLLNSVREANGDVIIALSDGDGFNPFTSPWPAVRKVLVAIPSFRTYSQPSPGLARNVVAHELGHAIGLGHNEDATSLMCSGAWCHFDFPNAGFFPLTTAEKAKLLEMYPPHWQPVPSRRWKADPPAAAAG